MLDIVGIVYKTKILIKQKLCSLDSVGRWIEQSDFIGGVYWFISHRFMMYYKVKWKDEKVPYFC